MASQYDFSKRVSNTKEAPVTPLQSTAPSLAGWISAMGDAVAMQPVWQTVSQTYQFFNNDYVNEPDFNPFAPEEIKGFENYMSEFMGVHSRREAQAVKDRILSNHTRRDNIDRELGLGGILLSEMLNPVNFIPLPGLVGSGIAKGALKGTTSFGGLLAGEELLRQAIDPTATLQESADNIVYGSLFGTILGGGAGAISRRGVNKLATEFEAEFQSVVRADDAPVGGDPLVQSPAGTFKVTPTDEAGSGVAPAFGLEKQTKMSLWGRLKGTGIRAVGDFADTMLGDFGTKSKQNAAGQVTQPGIDLGAGYWRGRAADALRQLEAVWNKAQHGSAGTRVMDVNVAVAKDQLKGLVGRAGGDGYMSFEEFKDAVFRAHKSDRIETDDPHVREGVKAVRQVMDEAMEAGVASGAIRSGEGFKRSVRAKVERARQLLEREAELVAKGELTPNEALVLNQIVRSQERTKKWFEGMLDQEIGDDGFAEFLDELDAKQAAERARWAETAKDIRGSGKKRRENTHRAMQWIDQMIARDRAILDYLNKTEVERGLTDKQRAYRDDLQRDLDALDEVDGESRASIMWAFHTPEWAKNAKYRLQDLWRRKTAGTDFYRTDLRKMLTHEKTRARMSPEQADLADRLLLLIDENIPVSVGNPALRSDEAHTLGLARFNNFGKPSVALRGASSPQEIRTLLHEAVHIAYIDKFGFEFRSLRFETDPGFEAAQDLDFLYQTAQGRTNSGYYYGMSHPDEFVAEALTNPDFQKWLKGEKLWQKFVDAIRKMIGLEPKYHDLLSDTLLALDELRIEGEGLAPLRERPARALPMEGSRASRTDGKKPDVSDETKFLSSKQRDYLEILERRMAGFGDAYKGPENEAFYLSRYWKIDEVLADEAGPQKLREILTKWFTENPLEGASINPEAIAKRVDDAILSITKQAEKGELQFFDEGTKGASFRNSRRINIPNELVFDFIETDVGKVLRSYSSRFGTMNEMAGRFGELSANDAIDDVMIQAAREIKATSLEEGEAMLDQLREQLRGARDRATGAIYSTEPEALVARRRARWARGYGTITMLGGAALSSIPEAARGMMVHGFSRTIAKTFDALGNPETAKRVTKAMRARMAEGNDTILGAVMQRYVEQGGPVGASPSRLGRAADKMSDFASGPYFLWNLLGPFTDTLKMMNVFWTDQFFIEDAFKFAKTGDAKLGEMFASYGLSPEDVRAIAAEPAIKMDGRLYDVGLDEWADPQLAHRYQMAMSGMARRIIPTAGDADLPDVAKGFLKGREFPLLTLPFQFMNYGFAAINKVLLSSLQGRDRSAMAGLSALFALGWLTEMIKTSDMYWDNMSVGEKAVRAVDRSGLFGLYSDVPTIVETATLGNVGLRPMMGMDPYVNNPDYFDAAGELGGPVVSTVADYARLMVKDDVDTGDVTGTIRRSLPFNSLFYVKGLFRDLERGAAGVLEEPPPE